jgi:3-phenylpropionate/trans-cinnamate dioxygenase ferredoxin subunit
VFNCRGEYFAIEDRCSHDDGPLAEGEFDAGTCTVECPRHGSLFDLRTGRPKTLPAYQPVETFPVRVEEDTVKLEVE